MTNALSARIDVLYKILLIKTRRKMLFYSLQKIN